METEKKFTRDRTPMEWLERLYKRSSAKKELNISFEEFLGKRCD
ncbi:MAG: hypothetical protein U5K55_05410 [Aliarcobacter sp.]|nr:hypothetical protein [Aliarcobacter sp.]